MLFRSERPLLISTARPEYLRDVTTAWLAKHGLNPEKIYMRPNDQEGVKDYQIKYEHLQDILKNYGQPVVWADDNVGNIQMLRENNVPVIFVNNDQ